MMRSLSSYWKGLCVCTVCVSEVHVLQLMKQHECEPCCVQVWGYWIKRAERFLTPGHHLAFHKGLIVTGIATWLEGGRVNRGGGTWLGISVSFFLVFLTFCVFSTWGGSYTYIYTCILYVYAPASLDWLLDLLLQRMLIFPVWESTWGTGGIFRERDLNLMTLDGLNRPEKEKSTSSRMPLCYQITSFWGGGGHTIWPLASPKAVTLTNSPGHNATLAQFVFCSIIWATQKSRRLVKTCQMCHRCRHSQSFISSKAKRTDLFFFWLFLSLSSHSFYFLIFFLSWGLRWGWAEWVSQLVNKAWEKEINSVVLGQFWSCYHLFAGLSLAAGLPPRALLRLGPMQTAVDEGLCEGRVQGFIRHPQRWDQKQITEIDLLTVAPFYSYLFSFNFGSCTEISTTMKRSSRISLNILLSKATVWGFDMSGVSFLKISIMYLWYCMYLCHIVYQMLLSWLWGTLLWLVHPNKNGTIGKNLMFYSFYL